MNFFLDSALLGLEYALLAVGVYITFRIRTCPTSRSTARSRSAWRSRPCCARRRIRSPDCWPVRWAGAAAGVVTGFLQTHCKNPSHSRRHSDDERPVYREHHGAGRPERVAARRAQVLRGARRQSACGGSGNSGDRRAGHAVLPDGRRPVHPRGRLERGHGARLLHQHDGSPLGGARAGRMRWSRSRARSSPSVRASATSAQAAA